MIVAVGRFDIRIPGCRSLKEKRQVVKTLTAGIRNHFNVSVAEVEHENLWQRAALAVAVASSEGFHARKTVREVQRFVERNPQTELLQTEVTVHTPDD